MLLRTFVQHRKQKLMSRLQNTYIYVLFIIILACCEKCHVSSQILRPFPPLFDAALNRPISTVPGASTCGLSVRNAFCKSSIYAASITQCVQEYCEHVCPTRTELPSFTDLLKSTSSGLDRCIVLDSFNTRPNSSLGDGSVFFVKPGPDCFLQPLVTPDINSDGAFTFTFWLWQEEGNKGTLLQKVIPESGEIIYEIQAQKSGLSFFYRSTGGLATVMLTDVIPSKTWTHIALQVYKTTLSFFMNGIGPGFAATHTVTLVSFIQDHSGLSRIGQNFTGRGQFLGRIQDFKFFNTTLTNREIQQTYTGVLPDVRIQPTCRCPPEFPRIMPLYNHYCIANGVPDNTGNGVGRLSPYSHVLEYVNDDDITSYWISKFQDLVELTVDLGDVFQVFFVVVQFYSPLPKAVAIERQKSPTGTWEVWQMYAEDCTKYFNQPNNGPLPLSTSVNCLQFGVGSSNVPYSKGNITFNLLAPEPVQRPGFNDFHNTTELHEFVLAHKVRVRFYDHYYTQNPRHDYYGVYEYKVTARCECNGHAETCDISSFPYKCNCTSDSYTEGNQCERCQPLYNNKEFRRGDQINSYICQPCECYGHASSCVYNETLDVFPSDHSKGGGGVCINCTHNTTGQFCDTCIPLYYRPQGKSKYAVDVCSKCDCYLPGVIGNNSDCAKVGGQCYCKSFVGNRRCDMCSDGYYNLNSSNPNGCDPCNCNTTGTSNADVKCHPTAGTCNCKQNVRGDKCDSCKYGYFNLTSDKSLGCSQCECNPHGSLSEFCDPTSGQCICKGNIIGRKCDQCANGYYDFNNGCKPCSCNSLGIQSSTVCNKTNGQCVCKPNTMGITCNQCVEGAFAFGSDFFKGCRDCSCDLAGTVNNSLTCDSLTGDCVCKSNVEGMNCNKCKGNTFGLNVSDPDGCQPCYCDPAGTQEGNTKGTEDLSCDQNTGKCTCLANRIGRRCDDCSDDYYVSKTPGGGCNACGCGAGTLPLTHCDSQTGQCQCNQQNTGVTGRTCTECQSGYYGYNSRFGFCTNCDCYPAGSLNNTCDPISGQCMCKQLVQGRRCDACKDGASILTADNFYGCSKAPSQQPPPNHVALSSTSLYVNWTRPDYPNGDIRNYTLIRNATLVYNGSNMEFTDTGLSAYVWYTYIVEARNDVGLVRSRPVTFRTLPGAPTGMVIVYVSYITSKSATFSWNVPVNLNGPLVNYSLETVTPSRPQPKTHWVGKVRAVDITDLVPFTNYTVTVVTCTPGGCLDSWPTVFSTRSDFPALMRAPVTTTINSTSLLITWNPPERPNGVIIFYELWIRGTLKPDLTRDPPEKRIFHPSGQFNPRPTLRPQENALEPPATSYVASGLNAFTFYEFQVLAENDIGKTASGWVLGRTGEATPLSTPTPTVNALSSTELVVSWTEPTEIEARGLIKSYQLYHYKKNNETQDPYAPPYTWTLILTANNNTNSHKISGLIPYRNYTYRIETCNSVGCINSSDVTGLTLQDVPRGLRTPVVDSYNSTVMEINWIPPTVLNGPDPVYSVQKTATALNFPPQVVQGTRFPGAGYYLFPPDTLPVNVGFTGIQIRFRTFQRDGLLLFAASPGNQDEIIVLQFRAGRPWLIFDPQDCVSFIEVDPTIDNDRPYNDGKLHTLIAVRDGEFSRIIMDGKYQGCASFVTPTNDEGLPYDRGEWHELKAWRVDKVAYIEVDKKWTGKRTNKCATGTVIGPNTGVYVGGLPPDFVLRRTDTDSRVEIVRQGFQGCILEIKILQQVFPVEIWKTLHWNDSVFNELAFLNWQGCPSNLERDSYHFMGQGYVVLPPLTYELKNEAAIAFSFRTESHTGLMFFSHGGPGIYFYIALVKGALYFEFSNKDATGSVTFNKPSARLCDGNWYSVSIEKKGQQATITVTQYGTESQGDPNFKLNVETVSDLYFGGVPEGSSGKKFIKDNKLSVPEQGFGGCIRDLRKTRPYVELIDVIRILKEAQTVNLDGCPPFYLPPKTCRESLIEDIYNGTQLSYNDMGLQPYSDYLYRVLATNDAGSGVSPWRYGRTKEGAPIGVKPPFNITVISGYIIQGSWQQPESTAGLLTLYALRAYNLDHPEIPPVEARFYNDTVFKGNITTAVPHTNYTVKAVACTGGGCSESLTGVNVLTNQEAPADVSEPRSVAGVRYLTIQWDIPGKPNGIITGYFLYKDGSLIYSGAERSFNVTNLQVYTAYQFYIRACTKVGCTNGPAKSLSTAELPPTFVKPPTLVPLGTTQVEARWEEPTMLNGVLQRYVLYLSTESGKVGTEIYNSTDFFKYYTISNLTAGTTYFITLSACTGGGCTHSEASNITTEESSPEGVKIPTITSPSSTELIITWELPTLPNGHITEYKLYHNEVLVYSGLDMTYRLSGLTPYSLHTFRVVACTVKGCASSPRTEGRTKEAPPEGFIVMDVRVVDARTVKVKWNAPEKPYGLIYYDVYFYGNFYANPEKWNYTEVQGVKSLYRGTNYSTWINVGPVLPMARYDIQVNASNTAGYRLSNMQAVSMPPGTPDGVKPPTLVSNVPTAITATWQPVGRANAQESPLYILQFREMTSTALVQDIFGPTTAFTFTKINLLPYTEYEFRLVARNSHGDTRSEWVTQVTRQDKPYGFDPPLLVAVGARYIDLTWQTPLKPNGIIKEYIIYQNNQKRESVAGNVTNLRADNLNPFTAYKFSLDVCTLGGCTRSADSKVQRTLEDVPESILKPQAVTLTPTSVQLTWSPPQKPNGLISEYILERRLNNSQAIYTIMTFLPTATLAFVDESSDLSPYTTYQYRIKVINGAGTGTSPWTTITTKSSRPSGMMPPSVQVLSPKSILVTWQPPRQANGRLESYVIRLPDPRREFRNTSVLSVTINDLSPYTRFYVTVTACTDGGCTESGGTNITTDPTIPEGQTPPVPIPLSQTLISVTWQGPAKVNGPNVRFELSRVKIRQPLEANATIDGIWKSVYLGTSTYFEDRGLPVFTTFKYRITVYNSVGQLTSDPTGEVTTHGGFPRKAADISVQTIDHLSIKISWITPSVVELQGSVKEYTVTAFSNKRNVTQRLDPWNNSTIINNLTPSTDYTIQVKITINGGSSITSEPSVTRTLDGAPEGLDPPVILILSETSIRVSWKAPQIPNGQITGYNIYINDKKIETNMIIPGSYIISDLIPYTVYTVLIEVCTVFDCTKSRNVLITTAEALPMGVTKPSAIVESPYDVTIIWQAPNRPNGIILRYDIYRVTVQQCSKIPTTTMYPETTKCTYIQCDILQNLCGTTCYSGPKICCNGVLHNSRFGYDCCGTSYVQKPMSDAVCCGQKFYAKLANYQCCGDRYVEVLPGQVCCLDNQEDRVTIGHGNGCCGSIPYSSTGSQICCDGSLYDGFGKQCCSKAMVSDTLVCCGDDKFGSAYSSKPGMTCCSTHYVKNDSSLCCTSDTGHSKVHTYSSAQEKLSANEHCCGLEKISHGMSCCNYIGYNQATHVCADVSNQQSGCGTGTVCQMKSLNTSFCDQCNFDRSRYLCGSVSGYYDDKVTPAPPNPTDDCVVSEDRIYSGMNLTFKDQKLQPFSQYRYAVSVINSAGGTKSDYAAVTTKQFNPEGVAPPVVKVDPTQLYAFDLTWSVPDKPNGKIIAYILTRDGIEIYRGLDHQYVDDRNILPYRSYVYILQACTKAGCTSSSKVTVATAQSKPEEVLPPLVKELSSSALHITWSPPAKPNGIIQHYIIKVVGEDETSLNFKTTQLSLTVQDLKAFTKYSVTLEACTNGGCTVSLPVAVRTPEDLPEGVIPPSVVVLTSRSAAIFWREPVSSNGIIYFYSIIRRWNAGAVYLYTGLDFQTLDTSLTPGVTYNYYLVTGNSVGNTSSQPRVITMPTQTPTDIPKLKNVTVLSATEIYVEWDPVTGNSVEVDQYRIIINIGKESELDKGVGKTLNTTLTGLKPYFLYEVRLTVCLKGITNGCGTGPASTVRTFESPPQDLAAPRAVALGPDVVDVSWKPPTFPNGVITQYLVYYRLFGSNIDLLINRVLGESLNIQHAGQDLLPYTRYEYKVVAGNSKGDISSPWTIVRTFEAQPLLLPSPFVNNTGAFGLQVAWQPPQKPNGIITMYQISYRKVVPSIQNPSHFVNVKPTVLTTTVSGLDPFSNYQVKLTAFNSVGNISSSWIFVQTLQSSPSGITKMKVEKISSGMSVILTWDPPVRPNGIITTYLIYEKGSSIALYQGLNREFEFRRLEPYTEYSVQQEACTIAGCTKGNLQSFLTAETAPSTQQKPTIGSVNSTGVTLIWYKPDNPNGQITMYEVLRRFQTRSRKRSLSDPVVIYRTTQTDKDKYEYVDSGLEPYSEYHYSIRTSNAEGSTQSDWQTVFTNQAKPEGIAPPKLSYIANNINSINIKWAPPTKPNGVIQSYQLQRNNSVPWTFTPTDPMEFNDTNLIAYMYYGYRIKACSAGGCTESIPAVIRTMEAAPVIVNPPTVVSVNSTSLQLKWQKPFITNGEIIRYELFMDSISIYSGLDITFLKANLEPYKEYRFKLKACTNGGCTESGEVTGRPDDDIPVGLAAPDLKVLSARSIEVSWKPPSSPNGVISSYDLKRDRQLIYTEGIGATGTLRTSYIDYSLNPGIEYTYVVIARNSKGSVESPVAKATTYSASPSGLDPPKLVPLSSTAIQVSWKPPTNPNGNIQNYTLYQQGNVIYSGGPGVLSFIATGLAFWTEFEFRVQACTDRGCELSSIATARTSESQPDGQSPPTLLALADQDGSHRGVLVTWEPTLNPNGAILMYGLERRRVITETTGISYGDVISVYNGTRLRYTDEDQKLLPYTDYQYRVTAANRVGKTNSLWQLIKTKEAPPDHVLPPKISGSTSTTISVIVIPPEIPNGVIRYYNVLFNGTVGSSSIDLNQTVGLSVALRPYTTYSLQTQACTGGGCKTSQPTVVKTGSAEPTGQGAVRVLGVNITSIKLEWSYPTNPNGQIIRFMLYQRSACPPTAQPFTQTCIVGEPKVIFDGLGIKTTVTNLLSYTAYEYQVQAQNDIGYSDVPLWVRVETLPKEPVYIRYPSVFRNGTKIVLDWSTSFKLNGKLREYILLFGGRVRYRGVAAFHELDAVGDEVVIFSVTMITDTGHAETPKISLDPKNLDSIGLTTDPPDVTPSPNTSQMFYREVWFIVLVVLMAVLLIFVIVALCLRHIGGRRPYIRERSPLKSRQRKSNTPFMWFGNRDTSSGSSIFETESSGQPYKKEVKNGHFYSPSVDGVTNPVFGNDMLASSFDRDSDSFQFDGNELDFLDEDDDDYLWEKHPDSGLYDGDLDSEDAPSYSITKEQTVFSDTHL